MYCLHCQSEKLILCGKNAAGSQRYKCKDCRRYSTLERCKRPNALHRDATQRALGLQLVFEGLSFRAAARVVGVHHQTIINWVNAAHRKLEQQKQPDAARVALLEVDEQWTYITKKRVKSSCSSPSRG